MTAPYGASLPTTTLSPDQNKQFYLKVLLSDLELLKDFDNVSGNFLLPEDSFVFASFYIIFLEKLTLFPPSLQDFVDFYTPNDKRVSLNFLFSFNSV